MRAVLIEALVLALVVPQAALADKGGKPHKDKKQAAASVTFSAEQRQRAQAYFVEKHGRGNCPPGLAKKNKACLPPGQAKKRYVVGQPLPSGTSFLPVPEELVVGIGAPPHGYVYGVIDGDLVKLVVGTLLVVDAIDGLVN